MSIRMKRILRGLAKSWSANFSLIVIVLGGLEQYDYVLTDLIGMRNTGLLLMFGGILGLVMRAKTTQSLEARGTK